MAYDPANRGGSAGSNYTQSSYRSNPSISGNWNTGGQAVSTGSFANGYTQINQPQTNRVGMLQSPRTAAIPVPAPKPIMAAPLPVPKPAVAAPVQRPFSTYVRSPYTNNPVYTPPAAQRPPSTYIRSPYSNNPVYTPRGGTSTHYKTTGPGAGQFRGGSSGRMGAGYARGGEVKKSSVLEKIKARAKPKAGIDTRSKVTPKKTPWKRGAMPAFAKGGAVEKFMAKYPGFKLA